MLPAKKVHEKLTTHFLKQRGAARCRPDIHELCTSFFLILCKKKKLTVLYRIGSIYNWIRVGFFNFLIFIFWKLLLSTANWFYSGWPLNVFLTPDLEPIFGGTYWPGPNTVASAHGQLGFFDVLEKIVQMWGTFFHFIFILFLYISFEFFAKVL